MTFNPNLSHIVFMNPSSTEFVRYITNTKQSNPGIKLSPDNQKVLYYSSYYDKWHPIHFSKITFEHFTVEYLTELSKLLTAQVSHD